MRTTKLSLAVLTLGLLSTFHANAQTEVAAPSNALRVATGKKGKGYSKLFANINAVCGDKVAMTEVETEGGLQNLTTLAANQADLGFAQLDTLQDMKASDDAIGALQAVLPLNMNLLHIVGRADGYSYKTERKLGGLMGGDKAAAPADHDPARGTGHRRAPGPGGAGTTRTACRRVTEGRPPRRGR